MWSRNCSPANKFDLTQGTQRSTLGLSCGLRIRAGSTTNPRGLGILTERVIQPGIGREHTVEEPPHGPEPGDHLTQRLPVGRINEHVPRVHRSEDQLLHHPTPPVSRVGQQAVRRAEVQVGVPDGGAGPRPGTELLAAMDGDRYARDTPNPRASPGSTWLSRDRHGRSVPAGCPCGWEGREARWR